MGGFEFKKKFGYEYPLIEFNKLIVKNTSLFNQSLKSANIDAPIFNNYVDKLCYSKDYNLRLKEVFSNSGEILDSASPLLKQIRKSILDFDKNITKNNTL